MLLVKAVTVAMAIAIVGGLRVVLVIEAVAIAKTTIPIPIHRSLRATIPNPITVRNAMTAAYSDEVAIDIATRTALDGPTGRSITDVVRWVAEL